MIYTAAANSGAARTGTMTIAGQTFTVTQDGAICAFALDSAGQSFDFSGGTGNVNLTSGILCAWSAVSNVPWITITSGSPGTGSGAVSYNVAANNGTVPRSGTITIGGRTFTVTQDKPTPLTCTEPSIKILETGMTYTTLQQAYDAVLDNETIQVQAVQLIGNLTVNRNISVTLAGGYSCDFGTDTGLYTTLKGAVQTLPGGGSLAIVNVNIKPNVLPPAVTTGAVTNNATTSVTLNGTVNPRSAATNYYFEWGTTTGYGTRNPLAPAYIGAGAADVPVSAGLTGLTPSTTYHYRVVAENIEGITNGLNGSFTTPCVFTLSPTTAIVIASSAGYNAAVTTNAGCGWTAVSNLPAMITVNSGTPGSGNGTVNYTVGANPSRDPRTGTLTIAGQTLTVQQTRSPCSYSLNTASQAVGT